MSIQFPAEFKSMWAVPGIRAAFVSDCKPARPWDCQNCGGRGFFTTFIATEGPYNSPAVGKALDGMQKANHFADGKWWIGRTHIAVCPVCKGDAVTVRQLKVELPAAIPGKDWMV